MGFMIFGKLEYSVNEIEFIFEIFNKNYNFLWIEIVFEIITFSFPNENLTQCWKYDIVISAIKAKN